MSTLIKDYGKDIAVAYRHNPLPFHQNAMPAAEAAEAARAQGKFWEMHDKLFAEQQNLDRPSLDKYAQEIGLNMSKFKEAMDKEEGKERIKRDMADAAKFGARGTPNFFINGRNLRGAQPIEAFKSTIDEEMKKADAKLAAGTPRGQLYAALIKDGLDKAAAPPPQAAHPGEPDANTRFRAEIKGAPMKGAKDAPVTIVQWSDFQCPFCSRVEPTISKVMDEYKGKVRVVWRDLPLPFHPNALPSAIAARAAGEQGKFWEMHDKLFADQAHEDRATFEKYAQDLGLNMGKFKAALDAQKGKEAIEADAAAGGKIGAHGTPAFFVNGKFLSGAQPYEMFKAKIDDELKIADAMIAKGTPKAKIYDDLMKDAKTEVPAAPAAPAQAGRRRRPTRTRRSTRCRGQRSGEGVEERTAADRDLLRLPVPVLQARRAEAVADREEVRRQGAHGLEELSAAVPQQRGAGGRGGHGGGRPGQVLGDARQAVREQHRARSREPREVRAGARPQHGQVQGRPRLAQVQGLDQGRHQRRPGGRRERHAGRLHQRT